MSSLLSKSVEWDVKWFPVSRIRTPANDRFTGFAREGSQANFKIPKLMTYN